MKSFQRVYAWLKKYGAAIAIVQAILWPVGIVFNEIKYGDDFAFVPAEDEMIHQVVMAWHSNNALHSYRSKDECEEYADDDSPYVLNVTGIDECVLMMTELEQIEEAAVSNHIDLTDSLALDVIRMYLYMNVVMDQGEYPVSVRDLLTE